MDIDISDIFYNMSPQAEIDEKRQKEESQRKAVVIQPNGQIKVLRPALKRNYGIPDEIEQEMYKKANE